MRGLSILSGTSANKLYIYRVPNLDANCYGPVTAIEYCYRFNTSTRAGSGPPTFNWIVLIFYDTGGNQIVIHRMYFIQSRASVTKCTFIAALGRVVCCDRTNINNFDLPQNFIFGVAESAQGNTHEAKLLGYSSLLTSQYSVSTVVLTKAGLTLSVGSSINIPSGSMQTGLRMLWFVIGKHQYCSSMSISYSTGCTSAASIVHTVSLLCDQTQVYHQQNPLLSLSHL